MQQHKDHTNYTAADIRRYVQGQLSAREMHAIEKAALDDPFLADAIEGMQQAMQEHGEAKVDAQLQQLHTAFDERTAVKKKAAPVVAFRWWQAAAAAAIVIVGALWIYNSNNPEVAQVMTVAQKEKAVKNNDTQAHFAEADSAYAVPVPASAPVQSTVKASAKKQQAVGAKQQAVAANKPASVAAQTALKKMDTTGLITANSTAVPSIMNRVEINDKRKEAINDALAAKAHREAMVYQPQRRQAFGVKTDTVINQAAAEEVFNDRPTELITIAKSEAPVKAAAAKDKNLSGFVKGRVTDPFNNPVARAYVKLPNNNYNILTDKTGFFKLPATDSVVDVSVNVAGYGTQNFRLQNNVTMNELQLQPANVSQVEAIVTGEDLAKYEARKKAQKNYPTVMVQAAEPAFGWVAYEQYLQNNKQLPAGLPVLEGNVAVSFVVNKKGELSDFKIIQSLNKSYDDEAIRLISKGPSWKLLKGRKARVTVIVRF